MDSNPRREYGQRTRQELVADIDMQEQLDNLEIDHVAVEHEELFDAGHFDYWPERYDLIVGSAYDRTSAYDCILASEVVLGDWMEPWPEFDGGGNDE